jgi:hypothetical protein
VFDTISGLPVHALVVHAVVVLVPLMSLVTIAVAVRAAWRPLARYVAGANVLLLVVAFVARQSGLAFQERLSKFGTNELITTHANYGKALPLFVLGLVVAAVIVMLANTRPQLVVVGIVVAVVAGLAALGWTVVTGDSGARAVWEETIKNT